MYEFTDKKIREKFKKTVYGKKVNDMLLKSLITMTSIIVVGLLCFLFHIIELISTDIFVPTIALLSFLLFMSIITVCYFDGKRDGAIEQYKRMK